MWVIVLGIVGMTAYPEASHASPGPFDPHKICIFHSGTTTIVFINQSCVNDPVIAQARAQFDQVFIASGASNDGKHQVITNPVTAKSIVVHDPDCVDEEIYDDIFR